MASAGLSITKQFICQPMRRPIFWFRGLKITGPQLARYGKLFGDDGLRVRLAIFYPVQGKLVELH
jgi:hypothetical protein